MSAGRLLVDIETPSGFLRGSLPIEVRDAEHRLVSRGRGWIHVDVPPGLYIVDATLPNGERRSEVVQVSADSDTPLTFGADPGAQEAVDRDGPRLVSETGDEIDVVLLDYEACEIRDEGRATWLFDPVDGADGTPRARFNTGSGTVTVSLPVNPEGSGGDRSALVRFNRRGGRTRADVGFGPDRRVATTREGLVKSGDVFSTAKVFENADAVLYQKYRDPSAAALAGLTLNRIGRLQERASWVENLARDFAWIADGRILLAGLLASSRDGRERDRGLELLLDVGSRRPLFSDGLALQLRLLRSWAGDARADDRKAIVEAITSEPRVVDWDAMVLTTYSGG